MTDNQIKQLAEEYRAAIVSAHDEGLFFHDIGLDNFPTGSCGDVSYLLAGNQCLTPLNFYKRMNTY